MIRKRSPFSTSRRLSLLSLIATSSMAGCATFVDSDIATDDEKGYVYYLPLPVIVVTPQTDGTATVEVEYLPDESKAYTLRARSLVSSYTLDVQTTNGMLKTVSLDADTAQVAKTAIDAAATVADKAYTAAKAERDKEDADRKAREAKERELRQAVAVAKQELRTLETLSTDAANGITAAKITEAKLAVIKTETILAVFLTDDLDDIAALGEGGGSFDTVTAKTETAPGPVMFQVHMVRDEDNTPALLLRAMAPQQDFETATVSKPSGPTSAVVVPHPSARGVISILRDPRAAFERTEKFNTEITPVDDFLKESLITSGPMNSQTRTCAGDSQSLESARFAYEQRDDKKELVITFPSNATLDDGDYCLTLVVTGKGLDEPNEVSILYEIATKPERP